MTDGSGLGPWGLGPGAWGWATAFAGSSVPGFTPASLSAGRGVGLQPDAAIHASGTPSDATTAPPVTRAPDAEAVADLIAPAACELGAHCLVSVRVTCPAGSRCELPIPGRLGPFEVLGVDEPGPVRAGGAPREWRLTLVAFEPGTLDLPPIEVRIVHEADGTTGSAATSVATIEVTPVAMADDAALRPDAPPMDPGPDWRLVAGWTLAALAALALTGLAWRWWQARRRRQVAATPAVTADRAIARIRAIATAPAASPEEILARYTALSDALRGYLGIPLHLPATALTSTELLGAIDALMRRAARGGAPHAATRDREAARARAHALLLDIDLVKFGGDRPGDDTRAGHCRRAIALIEEMEAARPALAIEGGHVA